MVTDVTSSREHSMSRYRVHGPTSTQWGSGSSLNCPFMTEARQNFWQDCKYLYLHGGLQEYWCSHFVFESWSCQTIHYRSLRIIYVE